MPSNFPRYLRRIVTACLTALAVIAVFPGVICAQPPPSAGAAPVRPAGLTPLPRVTSPRLYVIDCGTLINNRPEDFNLKREEVADTNLAVTCFLVIHPKGILLFDTGLSDRLVGRPLYENYIFGYGQIKMNTLSGQLADIGVAPGDITYLALSHSHIDHIGNANDYAGSIWLAQKAEMEAMFGARPAPPWAGEYAALKHARTEVIEGDHDVFGDGTVILKFTPGHTPGHQSLYVKLAKTGGVVISGDLFHYSEERKLDRMPTPEQKSATPASRALIEQFLKQEHAQLWIGHSMAFFRDATKAPGWYE
jgi:glyoxylase-like metal-dependent hydrolase (beta-lactamase superfamily II)